MSRHGFWAWRKSHVRGWIKALPLELGVPVMIGASSVKPEDAASNLAAWAQWIGIHDVPTWLNARRSSYKARVFVPSHVTPERLLSFFEENTAINATELTKRYIVQWMPVTGALRNVTAYGQVSFENAAPVTWFDYADILCYFRKDKIGDLKSLKRGDKITVIGQISRIGKLDLELDNCELLGP
jgi:hypothetical protein